ncbi:MAG: hypothetical protein J6N32_02160 [Clostridia bacterium]|nr:hypothetical protein [Clostridia bacterium]
MKIPQKPISVLCFLLLFCESLCYSLSFIWLSGHYEFLDLFAPTRTSNSEFWRSVTLYIQGGNLSNVGYLLLIISALFLLLTIAARLKHCTGFVLIPLYAVFTKGVFAVFLMAFSLLLALSEQAYCHEYLIVCNLVHIAVGFIVYFILTVVKLLQPKKL